MSGRRHNLFRNRSKISKENSSGRMDSLWGGRAEAWGENPGAVSPKRPGPHLDALPMLPLPPHPVEIEATGFQCSLYSLFIC